MKLYQPLAIGGPNDENYSTVTAHFITEDLLMELCVLDFKVFKGRTTGEFMYNDIQAILGQFQGESNIVLDTIGITNTTGNTG